MSEKNELFWTALDTLMKIKEQRSQAGDMAKEPAVSEDKQAEASQSGASGSDYTPIKAVIDTLMKIKEQRSQAGDTAKEPAASENKQAEAPRSGAVEPDYTSVQSANSYSPQHKFSWQNEARIAYVPGRERPAREERAGTPSAYSWPEDRRERRGMRTGPDFRIPNYWNKGENFALDNKSGRSIAATPLSGAQSSWTLGRESGFVRPCRAPYGFYRPSQA